MASPNAVASSSSSEIEEATTRLRGASIASDDRQTFRSERSHKSHRSQKSQRSQRQGSMMSSHQRGSFADNDTPRTHSPAPSQSSTVAAGIPYDSLSVTSRKSHVTNDSPTTAITSVSQQNAGKPPMGPHSDSTASTFGSSSRRPSALSQARARFDVAKAIFYQADTDHDGSISREEFRAWAQPGITYSDGQETAQELVQEQSQSRSQTPTGQLSSRPHTPASQLPPRASTPGGQLPSGPHTPAQQTVNDLLGPDAFKDVALNVDYGAVEAYNTAMRSSVDATGEEGSADTVTGDDSAASGPKKFDVVKAIFYQADTDHDGSISRDEFRVWAEPGIINGGQPLRSSFQVPGQQRPSAGNVSFRKESTGYASAPRNSLGNASIPRRSVGDLSAPRNSTGNASAHRNSTGYGLAPRNSVGNASAHRNSIGNASVRSNSIGGAAVPRNSVGNMSQPRNSIGNMSQPRNSIGNISQPRNSIGNMSQPRNSVGNMSQPRNSIGNISQPRNSVGNMSQPRNSIGNFSNHRDSFGSVSNPGRGFADDNPDEANAFQQGEFGEGASNFG